MITKIKNGKLILPDEICIGKDLYLENEQIRAITTEKMPYDIEIDAGGNYVSPGFIDMHVHGGGGADFMDGGTDAIVKAAKLHLMHGTTTILPTALSSSMPVLEEFLKDVETVQKEALSQADIAGVHIEGPYFADAQRGAQNPDYIKAPEPVEYQYMIEKYGHIIKRWSFAPELPGSVEFCKTLVANGILPSFGHTDAIYEELLPVYEAGCRMFTHFYSGMSMLTRRGPYRKLGAVESAYLLDGTQVEIIADNCHLPPELLRLILKGFGTERVSLVTDAMRGAGMPEGESALGRIGEEMPCIITDGVAMLPDKTSFAGSVATTDRLVRTMVQKAGVSVLDAIRMMSENPARLLGLSQKGSIKPGMDADIVIFDEAITVKTVLAKGKKVNLS